MDPYLAEKVAAHIAAILDPYIHNPDDLNLAVEEILDAIEQETVWATKP